MSPLLSQRTSLVLLASLAMALAFGLLAAGPILVGDTALALAGDEAWLGVPRLMNVLCSLPLGAGGVWGAIGVSRAGAWPLALRRPLWAFFVLSALSGVASAAFHAAPSRLGMIVGHGLVAAGCTMLLLSFLAERFGLRFGSPKACAAALAASLLGCLWWWLGDGDVRLILWLEALPALLVATGILGTPGLFTRTRDWAAMLALYVSSRVAESLDAPIHQLLGLLSGHALMHLGAAAVAVLIGRRAWQAATRAEPQASDAPASSSCRQTSFHTAG